AREPAVEVRLITTQLENHPVMVEKKRVQLIKGAVRRTSRIPNQGQMKAYEEGELAHWSYEGKTVLEKSE
ncbi:hypothetical protein P7K49_012593, partial [Saguinus oedipus]